MRADEQARTSPQGLDSSIWGHLPHVSGPDSSSWTLPYVPRRGIEPRYSPCRGAALPLSYQGMITTGAATGRHASTCAPLRRTPSAHRRCGRDVSCIEPTCGRRRGARGTGRGWARSGCISCAPGGCRTRRDHDISVLPPTGWAPAHVLSRQDSNLNHLVNSQGPCRWATRE